MPHYDDKGDTFASTSHFLSPSNTPPHKSPSRQSINNRRSTSSLRGSPTLARVIDDEPENSANGLHSLAHKLAVALLPEPSTSSQLLAEEFGFEYDDGAETIDEDIYNEGGLQVVVDDTPSFTDEMGPEAPFHNSTSQTEVLPQDFDLVFEPPTNARQKKQDRPHRPSTQSMPATLAPSWVVSAVVLSDLHSSYSHCFLPGMWDWLLDGCNFWSNVVYSVDGADTLRMKIHLMRMHSAVLLFSWMTPPTHEDTIVRGFNPRPPSMVEHRLPSPANPMLNTNGHDLSLMQAVVKVLMHKAMVLRQTITNLRHSPRVKS